MWSKVNAWIHLWFGLVSGIVVVILSVTGCVLVFETDIKELFQPHIRVAPQATSEQLPPSAIHRAVQERYPDQEIESAWYYGLSHSVKVRLHDNDTLVYVNPYTAEILAAIDHEDFFHFMDEGHRHLWLPDHVGRPVVGWATAFFFVLTISGLILWWPKRWNKRHIRQAFTIKWRARFKRVNHDLHNVLGFYALTLALVMCFTGLIMSFPLIRSGVIWLGGGYPLPPPHAAHAHPEPEEEINPEAALRVADHIWHTVRTEIAQYNKEAIIVNFPHEGEEAVYACTDMHNGSWRDLYFDVHTLELLPRSQRPIHEAGPAEWTMRSNYALHTGFVGGLTTKILYFLASLICASLPITGFYIWWGKRKKSPSPDASVRRKTGGRTVITG